jgi:predicted TIM-barrel fold metal-dependent hydrolase
MSETAPTQKKTLMEDETLVDVDVHLDFYRHPEEVAKYMDAPYDEYLTDTKYSPMTIDGWNRTMGGKIQPSNIHSAEQLHEELCGQFNVDYGVLNTFAYLPNFPDIDVAQEVMRGSNDMLIDRFLDEYDEFKGMAGIDPREPDKAAEEIDRLGDEKDIIGIYIENGAEQKPLGDPYYDEMYQAAEDNDLPVAYHSSAGSIFMQGYPIQHRGFRKFLEEHVVAHPFAMMATMCSLIVQGAPVKFPDLNFVILESGIEFLPTMMFRLNKEYSIRRIEAPLLEKSPEEYIRDSFYVGTQPIGEPNDPEHMRKLIEIAGPEMILFATDYPHWDFDDPSAVDKFLRNKFTDEQRNALMSGNAMEIYDI